jgi:hypothetical protein
MTARTSLTRITHAACGVHAPVAWAAKPQKPWRELGFWATHLIANLEVDRLLSLHVGLVLLAKLDIVAVVLAAVRHRREGGFAKAASCCEWAEVAASVV